MALLQFRRGTAAQWTAANPVLASGEPGRETDTGRRKVGDGVTAWTSLPYEFDGTLAAATYVPVTRTVAGKVLSADVTLAKGDVGLGSVDNTSDAGKPVSTAQSAALAAKEDAAHASATYRTGVQHGSTAGTARPSVPNGLVDWYGSVAPTNAATDDRWYDTANELMKRWTGTAWTATGSATYRKAARPLRQAGLGDSIMLGTVGVANQAKFDSLAAVLSGGRVARVGQSAVAGERSDQGYARLASLLTTYTPDIVPVLLGMNDAIQSVPVATFASWMVKIVQDIQKAGATPVLLTVTPKVAQVALIGQYNAWMTQWGRDNGVAVVDVHSLLVDPSTGALATAYDGGGSYTADGYHPNGKGRDLMAAALANYYKQAFPAQTPVLAQDNISVVDDATAVNMIQNGLMLIDLDGGGKADFWAFGVHSATVPTTTTVTRTGWLGKAQQLVFANIDASQAMEETRNCTAGHRLYVGFRIDIDNASADLNEGSVGCSFWLDWTGAAQTPVISYIRGPITDGLLEFTVTVPTGATQANPTFYCVGKASQNMTIRIGQATMIDLTALGL